MKPSVPETGIVIGIDNGFARVMLQGGEACRGCGQAKIGLCRSSGLNMVVTVKNTLNAGIGDTVIVGIDDRVRMKGYLLAFVIPLISFLVGSVAGLIAGIYLSLKGLEVVTGFAGLITGSILSLKRLHRLDRESCLVVKAVL